MKYVCIHGHFYQPPRENPSLEYVELQESAYPYHDWNERITAECYAPNAASRIMDEDNRIQQVVNNYAKISFNFGPTLLSWIEEKAPHVYSAIREADRVSRETFSGHGSAIAQAYNHIIMPLANRRDKRTQILWGLADFQHRFGRKPEGMWLPETAVDLETLDLLAEQGIGFTILAQRQAGRVRKIGSRAWKDVRNDRIDPTRAYLVRLPSRRKLTVFFYDGPISRAVAFEGLLNNGETFANRLLSGFSDERDWEQLLHIATDGESYGHHHRFGDMALAYALNYIEANNLARITNYGEYLEKFPPTHQVEIFEDSSWSCIHGIERWATNCGCNSGGHADWNQEWRAPLRAAFDWLRDTLAPRFEDRGRALFKDPWAARNDYIQVILDRSESSVSNFLAKHRRHELTAADRVTALKLLELQRHALLMYTSCGWFFDELSGLETVQVMHYAGRAVQLAGDVFQDSGLEKQLLEKLALAKSNIPNHQDGARIYEKFVKPAAIDLPKLAAHYAIRSVFEPYGEHVPIYCYTVDRDHFSRLDAGKSVLIHGRARFTSRITTEESRLSFCVLYLGDHNVSGGVRRFPDQESYAAVMAEISHAFSAADTAEALRLLDFHFDHNLYSLRSLFRDDQRKILGIILEASLSKAEASLRQQYDEQVPLMRFLADLHVEQPRLFRTLAEYALNHELREALKRGENQRDRVQRLLHEARTMNVTLDNTTLEFIVRKHIEEQARRFWENPTDLAGLEKLDASLNFVQKLPFTVNLWEVQNLSAQNLNGTFAEARQRADQGDESAKIWVEHVRSLADHLRLRVP